MSTPHRRNETSRSPTDVIQIPSDFPADDPEELQRWLTMVILAADDIDEERKATGMQLVSQGRVLQPLMQSLEEGADEEDHRAATHAEIDQRRRAGEWGEDHEADGDGKFEVEKTVGSRMKNGHREYKLKWKGCHDRDSSWRTAVKVPECWEIIIEYWERRARTKKINLVQDAMDIREEAEVQITRTGHDGVEAAFGY